MNKTFKELLIPVFIEFVESIVSPLEKIMKNNGFFVLKKTSESFVIQDSNSQKYLISWSLDPLNTDLEVDFFIHKGPHVVKYVDVEDLNSSRTAEIIYNMLLDEI